MDEPFISSDPNAWLRPFWAALKQQPFFANLAPELQAEALAAALETDYPAKAQEIREWNVATRRAMLMVLDTALLERHAAREMELWTLRKDVRELHCVAVYLPTGIDLRILEDGEMRRTSLCREAPGLHATARHWRTALQRAGWTTRA